MKYWPRWLAVFGLALVLGAANYTIAQRQQVVDHGRPLLLNLRPVDPRSLMQGDYMTLRYAQALFPPADVIEGMPRRGTFVVKVDANNVATFSRLDDGSSLRQDEARLRYKLLDRNGDASLGAESYFFQEGRADDFADARYGVLNSLSGKSFRELHHGFAASHAG